MKINALLVLWLKPGLARAQAQQFFQFVVELGKCSMLDVFVVARLVLTGKSGGLASSEVQDGFFLFFTSVMLTQCASFWAGKDAGRLAA